MTIRRQILPFRLLIRRSVRYLLVKRGFRLVEAVVVLAALAFVLTGSRIAAIDRLGNRADIVASVVVTALSIMLLRAMNRRVMIAIDRRFFREAYDAQVILTELGEAIRTYTKIEQLLELVAASITAALHPENVTIFLEDEATGELVAAFSSDDASAVDATPTRPALVIPIKSNGHLYGAISLGRRLGDLPYSKEDEQLLLAVAGQMAIVVENASLIRRMAEEESIRRELETAAEVQRRLFPAGEYKDAALELYGTCLPARWVGGDYYDYFAIGERRVGVAIGDVAGKGIAAALLMSTVQALLRSQLTSEDRRLTEVVSTMNRLLRGSTGDGGYVTFFLAEFDEETRGLTYVNAGHNPPLLFRRREVRLATDGAHLQGKIRPRSRGDASVGERVITIEAVNAFNDEAPILPLNASGPVIGTFLDTPYEQETVRAESGDVLVAFTDGVTEALSPEGVEFGEERLRAAVIQSWRLTARGLAEKVIADVLEWQGDAPQHDDITLVVAKFN
jgi:sigma-B regulation protein RsbU (phosphoserine phosphatase)